MEEDQLIACRICQSYSIIFINLYDADTDKDLVNLIEEVIGVELLKGSGIPTTICTQCHSDFLTAQGFRQKCIESNKFFSTRNDLSPIKTEIVIKDEEINEPQTEFEDLVEFSDGEYTSNPTEDRRCSEYDEEIPKIDPDTETFTAEPIAETTKNNKFAKKKREFNLNRKQRHKTTCPIVCDICGNVFKSKNVFALHLRRHNNNKPYDCELCTSRFFTNSELTRHMRRHTGEKPYQCKHCERRFSDYGTLIKHQRTHTNDRPYRCLQCGKSFICGFVLKNHMLTHTGERAFNCDVCNKSFGRQHNLTTHMKSNYHQKNAIKIAEDELDII